jgi:hypothetical protein
MKTPAATFVVLTLVLNLSGACAQVLSSPLGVGAGASPRPDRAPPAGAAAPQGAGVHSPLSPVAPLSQRADVLAWSVLTDVSVRVQDRRLVTVYPQAVQDLDQKNLRLQGFMMPLEPGLQQRHFLLASVPLTCAFCTPGGPESMVEVRTRSPVTYTQGAVVVQGRFHVLQGDASGLYYRMTEAEGVK